MIGKIVSHYKILEKIGAGGMGVVFKAKDIKLDRMVALKFLPPNMHLDSDAENRLVSEAKAASSIDHPNICTIYEIDKAKDGQIFIAMACYEGETLKNKLKDGPLSIEQTIQYGIQIANGLQRAHKNGIIHRDIKPANIFITSDGMVKILDFGLAKVSTQTQFSIIESTSGTIAYMSPEQTRGGLITSQTDIWSLGVVFFQMITGELPFKGEYEQAIIYSILNEEPDVAQIHLKSPAFSKIVEKALQKDCDKRYASMDELLEDISEKNSSAPPPTDKPGDEIKRLAILPFSNIMNDPQTNFLGFALADQIIGAMAYSKYVQVRPSSSVRRYQDEIIDIQKAGSELNVKYILAGNYLKEADTIRLNIELIDLESDKMIWREPIEIKYKNVFELQDIVSQKVVKELKVQFSPEERERMRPEMPHNSVTYDQYLQAISYPFSVEGNENAIEILNNAIKLDPSYAPAYSELGSRYHLLSQIGTGTIAAQKKAEEALLKALSLKPDLLPALANLGLLYTDSGRHEQAHDMLIRALKINPNNAWLHFSLSYHYRYIGFLDQSKKEADIAIAIDPNNPRFRSSILTSMYLGRFDEILNSFDLDIDSPFTLNHFGEISLHNGNKKQALEYFKKSVQIKDEIGEFYFAAAFIEFINGNFEKAKAYNLKRELENPADSENFYEIARTYGLFMLKDDCYRALKRSIDMGYVNYPAMQNDSFLDSVRQDSGIKDLLGKVQLIHEELKEKLSTSY